MILKIDYFICYSYTNVYGGIGGALPHAYRCGAVVVASIITTNKEKKVLDKNLRQRLLKLHQATPNPMYFLAGIILAHLHLRIFSVFGQLCRLKNGENILAIQVINFFSSANHGSGSIEDSASNMISPIRPIG